MTNHPPTVSVLMPVYNAQAYLEKAINSILAQEFQDFELLIVDDGSSDSSLKIVQALALTDVRINYRSRDNQGICATRNELLQMASGAYIAWMDADDISLPDRLRLQIAFLDDHPDYVAVGCHTQMIDKDDAIICGWPLLTKHEDIDNWHINGKGGAIIFASAMMRKQAILDAGGFDTALTGAEDLSLFLKLAETGKLANIADNCYSYRQHIDSICHGASQQIGQDTQKVVNAAAARRGLAPINLTKPTFTSPNTKPTIYNKWAWWALLAGNKATARKYAIKSVSIAPFSVAHWKTLFYVLRGY